MNMSSHTSTQKRAITSPLKRAWLAMLVSVAVPLAAMSSGTAASAGAAKPTVVLVHGAFAGSSSWNAVTERLLKKGYPVIAVANPLRSVKTDAAYVSSVLKSVDGPVVLVGHSYGGSVITDGAAGNANVKALVYVSGFAPDVGETAGGLNGKFPGSTLGPTLAKPVALGDGKNDLYISQDKFHAQFAADVDAGTAAVLAATQRPIVDAAFNDATETATWKSIPSWFVYGTLDKNIPPALHAFMAQRAGSKKTVVVTGSSHVVMVSHPDVVANLIETAAAN